MKPRITYRLTRRDHETGATQDRNRYRWDADNGISGVVLRGDLGSRSKPATWIARRDGGRWVRGFTRAEAANKAIRD